LVGNASTQTVRAYQRDEGERFTLLDNDLLESRVMDRSPRLWKQNEQFLTDIESGERKTRLPGHIAYWFAWDSFSIPRSELYSPDEE